MRRPRSLRDDAVELWEHGIRGHIANKLARAGITRWDQILELADQLELIESLPGCASVVRHEVRKVLMSQGIHVQRKPRPGWDEPPAPGSPPWGLHPEAEGLWRMGLPLDVCNRLAHAGMPTWEQVLTADLANIAGIGKWTQTVVRIFRAREGQKAGHPEDLQSPAHLLPKAFDLFAAGLSVAVANRLARNGLTTVEAVLKADLDSIPGIGSLALRAVEALRNARRPVATTTVR